MSGRSAPGYAGIDELFGAGVTEQEDVTTPAGHVVRVRGLTRAELLLNAKDANGDSALIERRNLASCLLTPSMTIEQAERWQRTAAAGELVPVVDAIRRLSGLAEGAAKSRLPGDGGR